MDMSNETKTIEDRFIDIILPLIVWQRQKAFGSVHTSAEWHQIAISLVPPPDSLCSNIMRGYKAAGIYDAYATEAVYSPSRRRKLRRYAQHRFQRTLRKNYQLRLAFSAARDWLLQWRRTLEAAGYTADLTRIRKLRDVEAKIKEDFDVLAHNTTIIDQWLPPEKVLDPKFYSAIMRQMGREGYAYDVIVLLQEFALYARALEMQGLTPKSPIFALLGFDKQKLEAPETCLIEFLERFLAMLGISVGTVPQTEDVQLDCEKIGEIFRWMICRELPKMILGKNYSVRDKREVSLDKSVGQHATLKDVLPDHRATEEFDRFEKRMVIESSLEQLPAAQREAVSFFLKADDEGKSPEELRYEVGEKKYERLKRNERRARKTLEYLRKSGKLLT